MSTSMTWVLTDSWTMTRRELAHWARQPVQVVVSLVFPVMLLLMFGYLIGGGRGVQGSYVDYLVPGMLALTMAFGLEGTLLAVTQDLNKGVIDRFRSMPMAPSAVVAGRCLADMAASVLGLAVLMAAALGCSAPTKNTTPPGPGEAKAAPQYVASSATIANPVT